MNRSTYIEECAIRWHGEYLENARHNWNLFQRNRETLETVLKPYLKDAWVPDLNGKHSNPNGTLTSWLWVCSKSHSWLVDFCEGTQTCHLSRGIIQYCKQLIAELEAADESCPYCRGIGSYTIFETVGPEKRGQTMTCECQLRK